MPTLLETIGEYEEDLLQMIAGQWGIGTTEVPSKKLSRYISENITQETIRDFLDSLTNSDMEALKQLASRQGRLPWPQFARQNGDLREMGAARRLRERPDAQPATIAESLYYKGLIGKAFFDSRSGPREFAYIPDEILALFSEPEKASLLQKLPALPEKKIQKKWIANDYIIDHASTLLAALRIGSSPDELNFRRPDIPVEMMTLLVQEADLITANKTIKTDQVKTSLESNRGAALFALYAAWKLSERINELSLIIHELKFEKAPANNPVLGRSLLIDLVSSMPDGQWFGRENFIDTIHETQPDILRKAGEYDTWFVTEKETGTSLSGFENWKKVEGRYLRIMIDGPLYWFGILDLGRTTSGEAAFRKSQWASSLLEDIPPVYRTIETREFTLDKNGQIIIDRYFPRDIRYQVARFCELESQKGNRYFYRITPFSLRRMAEQKLAIRQLLSLLHKYAHNPLPANIISALDHWEKNALQVEIKSEILIRVESSRIMDSLIASQAKPYIRERLNGECALADSKGIPAIHAALLELGYFAEISNFSTTD